jgi:protein gp37
MSGISGPAVYSCPWCGRSVEQGEAAGVPFFFKSWGDLAPCRLQHIDIASAVNRTNGRYHWELDPECKGDMRRVGKKAAGNVIDGRTWEQFPEVNRG